MHWSRQLRFGLADPGCPELHRTGVGEEKEGEVEEMGWKEDEGKADECVSIMLKDSRG